MGNRSYPSQDFYLNEPMLPFSCMDEADIRPIEQRLPDNDTVAARKAAKLKKQKEAKQQQQQNTNRRSMQQINNQKLQSHPNHITQYALGSLTICILFLYFR